MRVRFVGSGDAFGSGGRFQTCILVETGTANVLLDCGATSLVALKQQGIDPSSVGAVCISHLHGDHFGGLPFLILDGQFARRERPLLLAGPPGFAERLRAAQEALFPGSAATTQRYPIRVVEYDGEPLTVAEGVTLHTYEVEHASGAPPFALRLTAGGRTVAYTGDTAWTERLIPAAYGADLLIAEAYMYDKRVKFHLDYQALLAHQAELHCQRLLLTHMSSDMLAHLDDNTLEAEPAHDGLSIDL